MLDYSGKMRERPGDFQEKRSTKTILYCVYLDQELNNQNGHLTYWRILLLEHQRYSECLLLRGS